jgi:hypothetical protein
VLALAAGMRPNGRRVALSRTLAVHALHLTARALRACDAMEITAARVWRIVVHAHPDHSFTVRVWVDGKLLLPDCVACTSATAIAYVAEALIDARQSDELAVRTQGKGGSHAFRAADAAAVGHWLAERMQNDGKR